MSSKTYVLDEINRGADKPQGEAKCQSQALENVRKHMMATYAAPFSFKRGLATAIPPPRPVGNSNENTGNATLGWHARSNEMNAPIRHTCHHVAIIATTLLLVRSEMTRLSIRC